METALIALGSLVLGFALCYVSIFSYTKGVRQLINSQSNTIAQLEESFGNLMLAYRMQFGGYKPPKPNEPDVYPRRDDETEARIANGFTNEELAQIQARQED